MWRLVNKAADEHVGFVCSLLESDNSHGLLCWEILVQQWAAFRPLRLHAGFQVIVSPFRWMCQPANLL
jgi:hypothetical protein